MGHGAFGTVYKLEKDNKYYAYKKILITNLSKEEIDNYLKEAKILSQFNNEYIIKYYYSFIEKDYFNILMEYGGDQNLKQFIQNRKQEGKSIEENIIKNIINQICLGLKEIHKKKLIHRDLTPENIFINKNYKIKIGDFGVSKKLSTNNKYAKTLTGKMHYNPPEVEKREKYDYRADIYTLGCVIYELFTLNEYYLDKLDEKECKIDVEYNKKWQELINLLLKKDYHDRPTIDEVYNKYIIQNEITLTLEINKENINKEIYFLNKESKEMNEENTELYINSHNNKFKKFFIPEKEGIYTIKLVLNFLIKDCNHMFSDCINITNIDLSSFSTENVINMNSMFDNCKGLKKINLSYINTENVTNMIWMFYGCLNLESLDISSFNTEKITNINHMFYNCNKLQRINFSSFNTKNIIDMSWLFGNCYNLEKIDLSSFNTENVSNMDGMFDNCKSLKSIDLSSFNTKNVSNMSYMFGSCHNLENINLSSFNTENVTDMTYMFDNCKSLKSLDLSSFNTKNFEIMDSEASDFAESESIILSSITNNSYETLMTNTFDNCDELINIKVTKNFFNKLIKDNPKYKDKQFIKDINIVDDLKDFEVIEK